MVQGKQLDWIRGELEFQREFDLVQGVLGVQGKLEVQGKQLDWIQVESEFQREFDLVQGVLGVQEKLVV